MKPPEFRVRVFDPLLVFSREGRKASGLFTSLAGDWTLLESGGYSRNKALFNWCGTTFGMVKERVSQDVGNAATPVTKFAKTPPGVAGFIIATVFALF